MKKISVYLFVLFFSSSLFAQQRSIEEDPVLIFNDVTSVRLSEFRADLTRLPEGTRGGFVNNRKRIDQVLQNLLEIKTFAVSAEKDGIADIPENAAILAHERNRLLALFVIEDLKKKWGEEFDSNVAQFELRAKEQYLLDKKFTTPEKVKASHILFSTEKHSDEEAKNLALDAKKKALGGEDFNALAGEISEDPSAQENKGSLGWFSESEMQPEFSQVAFSLKKEGDISDPVKTKFGWHIIRFEGRTPAKKIPFEDVKNQIMDELKDNYVREQQNALAALVRKEHGSQINEDAVNEFVFIAPLSGREARELSEKNKQKSQ